MNFLVQYNFIFRAIFAGVAVAALSGPLGCIMSYRQMAYFGDTLAHATLLGLALALLLNINIYLGLVSVCLLVAVVVSYLFDNAKIANDTVLGILSHFTLSLGLVLATFVRGAKLDLLAYLYGDILAVNNTDLIYIAIVMLIIMLSLSRLWNKIISAVISPEIAHCEGVNIRLMQHTFTLLLTLVFAVAIKIVGVLLLTSLLIIPAAAARFYAKSPFSMAVIASSIGVGSVIIGMFLSLLFDWPAGPAIVISSAFAFFTAYAQYKVIH